MFELLKVVVLAYSALTQSRLDVKIVTDEPRAVLRIIELRQKQDSIASDAWRALQNSEGYTRLKDREAGMKRAFTDSAFQAFVLSNDLAARASKLRSTLDKWSAIDANKAAARALSYLPATARIKATIYPVIKPRTNSFVWDAETNPAIFLYLDPDVTDAAFENTLAHELHHIGYASVCKNQPTGALAYAATFTEGRAVLAAAGSPNVDPHATSPERERAIWNRDFAKVPTDMQRLEEYFTAIHDKKLTEEQADAQWPQFVSTDSIPQGAFYTVGYLMSKTIEEELGRDRLVASLCDPLQMMMDYNEAARRSSKNLPRWSNALLEKLAR